MPKVWPEHDTGREGVDLHECQWRWNNGSSSDRCTRPRNLRHGSWYTRSNLTLGEVMLLAYDIITKVPSQSIEREYELILHPRYDWFQFCTLVILDYVETMSEKTGG